MCDCACDELREDVAELRETVERQQSEIDRAHRRITEAENENDELRETIEEKDERIMQLEVTVDQQADRIQELEEQGPVTTDGGTNAVDEGEFNDLKARLGAISKRFNGLLDLVFGDPDALGVDEFEDGPSIYERVEDVETTLQGDGGAVTPEGSTGEEGEQNDLTPLERLVSVSEENAAEALTANQRRAWHIAKDIDDYQTGTAPGGDGKLIDSATIGKILKAAGEDAHTQTVRRVMDYLEDFADGKISSKKRNGRRVMVIDNSLIDGIQRWRHSELNVDRISSQRGVISLRESGAATA